MKKLLVSLAAVLAFNAPAIAQPDNNVQQKPVPCYPSAKLFEIIATKFKEQPLFVLASELSQETLIAMFVNPATGSYTLIEFNADLACILGSGANFKLMPLKPAGDPV